MATSDELAPAPGDSRPGAEPAQAVSDESLRLVESGDVEAAQEVLQRADGCGPTEAALRLGRLLESRGHAGEAEAAYRRADAGGSAEGAFELGWILHERGDLEGAEAAYRRADDRGSAEGARFVGLLLHLKNNLAGAEKATRRADERGSPEGARNLGVMLQQRGDLDGAEAAYRRADERGVAEATFNLGILLEDRGETAAAEAAFRRADERGLAEGALNLGRLLAQQGEMAEAEAAYRRADERASPQGAQNLGVMLQQRGDLADAEAAYRRADERGHEGAIGGLVSVLVQEGERDKAEAVVSQAVHGPDPARAFAAAYTLAQVLTDLNMPAAAERPARQAIELGPQSPWPHVLLAAILTMRGQRDEAEEELRKAAGIGPADHGAAAGDVSAEPQSGEGAGPGSHDDGRGRIWLRRLASMLASLPTFGSRSEPVPDQAKAETLAKLRKLGEELTYGFARLLAGHQVTDLPVERAVAERLAIELRPLLAHGYAYRPNFGQYGELQVFGDLADKVRIELTYMDSSVRESRDYKIITGYPRDIRMTAEASAPYETVSSFDFTVVHGRPTPTMVLPAVPSDGQAEEGPPWPHLRSPRGPAVADGIRCETPGCQRTRVGQTQACLAHLPRSRLEEALAEHVGELDASGMTITSDLLAAICKTHSVRPLRFDGAIFDTLADFSDRLLIGAVSFEFASFRQGALFARSVFTKVTSFSGAEFSSEAVFDGARFHGAALFDAVRFRGDASFEGCAFHGGASFSNSQFSRAAAFGDCQFRTDVRSVFTNYLSGAATFAGSQFEEPPGFSPVLVSGVCDFDGVQFASNKLVALNIACSAGSFVDADFAGGADLMLSPSDVILDGATFGNVSTLATWRVFPFYETREVLARDPWARARLTSVRGARIGLLRLQEVDLRACRFDRAHGLETARIEGSDVFAGPPRGFRVRRPVVAEEWSWRSYGRRGGPSLERIGITTSITRPSGTRGWAQIPEECEPPEVLADAVGPISRRKIMATYHDLRVARENMHDLLNAADFYYSEMQMRGEHDHSSVLNPEKNRSWIELILVRIFWVISGYDVRPARSVISFVVVIMAGAVVLWQVGYRAGTSFGHAAITSLSSATALFGGVDWDLLTSPGQLTEIVVRVCGPILLALTALGIRSRARR